MFWDSDRGHVDISVTMRSVVGARDWGPKVIRWEVVREGVMDL
jgi:hypothetical protein